MSADRHVRGVLFVDYVRMLRRQLPSWREVLSPADAELVSGRVDVDAWYPMASFERLGGRSFQRILMVGGGAKNRLLCQATADAAVLPVVAFALEGTAVGNLARQLIALGAVKDLTTFRTLLAPTLKPVTYNPRG